MSLPGKIDKTNQYLINICHRYGNWVKKKTERFGCIYSIRGSGMDAGGCTDEW